MLKPLVISFNLNNNPLSSKLSQLYYSTKHIDQHTSESFCNTINGLKLLPHIYQYIQKYKDFMADETQKYFPVFASIYTKHHPSHEYCFISKRHQSLSL